MKFENLTKEQLEALIAVDNPFLGQGDAFSIEIAMTAAGYDQVVYDPTAHTVTILIDHDTVETFDFGCVLDFRLRDGEDAAFGNVHVRGRGAEDYIYAPAVCENMTDQYPCTTMHVSGVASGELDEDATVHVTRLLIPINFTVTFEDNIPSFSGYLSRYYTCVRTAIPQAVTITLQAGANVYDARLNPDNLRGNVGIYSDFDGGPSILLPYDFAVPISFGEGIDFYPDDGVTMIYANGCSVGDGSYVHSTSQQEQQLRVRVPIMKSLLQPLGTITALLSYNSWQLDEVDGQPVLAVFVTNPQSGETAYDRLPLEQSPSFAEHWAGSSAPVDLTKRLTINTPANASITNRSVQELLADGTLTGEFADWLKEVALAG